MFSPHSDDLNNQLYYACLRGNEKEVLELLHRGADPDHFRYLALHRACENNHFNCAELLIKWGASLSITSRDGSTALHCACEGNSMKCVELLMSHDSPTSEPEHFIYRLVTGSSHLE